MNKIGRNDPCPCGSGRKFKNCCLEREEASRREQREASNAALNAEVQRDYEAFEDFHRSEEAADKIWMLIDAGSLEAAEDCTREYIDSFPESPVGFDMMAGICEARGEWLQAAHWLHQLMEFSRQNPGMFTPRDKARIQHRIDRFESRTP